MGSYYNNDLTRIYNKTTITFFFSYLYTIHTIGILYYNDYNVQSIINR